MSKAKEIRSALNALKVRNRRDVLEILRNSDTPLTIARMTPQTSLSKMTVHKIVEYLVNERLILPIGKGKSGEEGGKRPVLFAFNKNYRFIFSIKIGETSLLAAIVNLKAEMVRQAAVEYDRETGLAEIFRFIQNAFTELTGSLHLDPEECIGIAVGCHGITDSGRGLIVTSPHFPSWGANIPIRDKIAAMLPFEVPVFVDNWVRYFAYGEMKRHSLEQDTFLLICTGMEGINAGLIMNGRLISGRKGLAGEIGHMIVDPGSTEACVCGGIGCLEVAVSLRRMERRAKASRGKWPDSILFRGRGEERVDYRDIFNAANGGDTLACSLMDEAAGQFALAINNIVQVCEPGLILIQGVYAAAGEYFLAQLRTRLAGQSLLRMDKEIRVEYTDKGDEGCIEGSAAYVSDFFFAHSDVADS